MYKRQIYGIDISKDTLDIYEKNKSKGKLYKIPNKKTGIEDWLDKHEAGSLYVLEPTGCYSKKILYYLREGEKEVKVINPNQSHGFTQALGIISKNDAQAAKTLAIMGERLDFPPYRFQNDEMENRKQLLSTIRGLKKQRQMLKNQLHAFSHQIVFAKKAVVALRQTLTVIEQQIEVLETELHEIDDEEQQQQLTLMQTVVGIGDKTAQALLGATGGLHNFDRAAQLSKFVGLAPSSHTSGSSVYKKGGMTKKGDPELRACLYMATRSARRYNHSCRELYNRLTAAGKCHKVAAVAVMNKLIKQVFGVVSSGTPFDNQFYLKFK